MAEKDSRSIVMLKKTNKFLYYHVLFLAYLDETNSSTV